MATRGQRHSPVATGPKNAGRSGRRLARRTAPRGPRKITDAQLERAIATTLESTPRDATHWNTRELAKHEGLSQSTVSPIWKAFDLQPHRVETFKLSKDPLFIDKVRDIVGLYLHPPHRVLVLCVDEKNQIQALDRTAPVLPMRPGLPARRTHDYVRHGTTTLLAALDVKAGTVVGACHARHLAQEFRQFLSRIDEAVPADLDLLRLRGERLEQPFAHLYETGGMRRVHLRGRTNIRKRVLTHAGGIGVGTPRGLQNE